MTKYKARTAKAWRHSWQVVRLFRNGALIVNCSHRFETGAYWHASVRQLFNRNPRVVAYDIRQTPEVVGRHASDRAAR